MNTHKNKSTAFIMNLSASQLRQVNGGDGKKVECRVVTNPKTKQQEVVCCVQ